MEEQKGLSMILINLKVFNVLFSLFHTTVI